MGSIQIVGSKRRKGKINRKEVGRAALGGISQVANNSNGLKSEAMDLSLISCIIFVLQLFFEIQIAKNSNMFSHQFTKSEKILSGFWDFGILD